MTETVKACDENLKASSAELDQVVEHSEEEIKESPRKLKTEKNLHRETAMICLDNVMLDCKVEKMEEEMSVLKEKIKELEERLKEEQEMQKVKLIMNDYNTGD